MEKNTSKNSNKKFLTETNSDVTQRHKSYLGTDIPEGYFTKSKLTILNKIKLENDEDTFLKEDYSDITEHHTTYLGTEIPENYFKKSKRSILDKIKEEEQPKKQLVFYMSSQFKYIAAAVIVCILSLTVWLQNSDTQDVFNDTSLEEIALEDNVLIESLLVEDTDIDAFADATIFNEVVVKAEISEQNMDNLILNSLIIEDSLLDNYMDDELLKTIIL